MKKNAGRRALRAPSMASSRDGGSGSTGATTTRPNSASRGQPYCLIVGGGQGGLALAARLKQLGVPTLIVDALPRPGDGWRRRYRSLCLHDPVWYDHMPYLPFPDNWPVYTPKDKMGDWLEAYASDHGARHLECDALHARCIRRRHRALDGRGRTRRPDDHAAARATGAGNRHGRRAEPPAFKGQDRFRGIQHHSSEHKDGAPYAGKTASSSARTIPPMISRRTCGSMAPTSR